MLKQVDLLHFLHNGEDLPLIFLEGRIPGILKQSQPKTISVQNLIIDNTGVSVSVSVSAQILALNEGNLDGWPISIDKFHISILNNQFLKGGFGGQLKISILKDSINYNATFFGKRRA
ncbi:MAG: hypothetical protein IPH36_05950 [Saprospiraceae bacterium]|nr:hypothetical protein [Saprospiraceae bacterium]